MSICIHSQIFASLQFIKKKNEAISHSLRFLFINIDMIFENSIGTQHHYLTKLLILVRLSTQLLLSLFGRVGV